MKKNIIKILSITSIFYCGVTLGQTGWTTSTRIFDLRVFNGTQILGQTLDTNVSEGCPSASTNFQLTTFLLDLDSPLAQETYSLLLTAQTTGREVQLFRTPNCNDSNFLRFINGARLRN